MQRADGDRLGMTEASRRQGWQFDRAILRDVKRSGSGIHGCPGSFSQDLSATRRWVVKLGVPSEEGGGALQRAGLFRSHSNLEPECARALVAKSSICPTPVLSAFSFFSG